MLPIRLSLPAGPIPATLFESPGFLVTWLADRLTRLYASGLKHFDIRPAHHAVLIVLADLQPMRQARLEQRLRVDHATFVTAVNDLERRELLQREPDPTDRRTLLIHLTDDGLKLLTRVETALRHMEEREFAALGDREQARLVTSLGTVVASLAGDRPDGRNGRQRERA